MFVTVVGSYMFDIDFVGWCSFCRVPRFVGTWLVSLHIQLVGWLVYFDIDFVFGQVRFAEYVMLCITRHKFRDKQDPLSCLISAS